VSRTAGTIFQDTRTPLTVWFAAAWHLTTHKNGISALGLKRVLGLGSYQTAWAMLHSYRTAMVRPGRERLNGDVEADESFFGGVKPGKRGRGAAGKVLVAIAVEQRSPTGYGRARMRVIPDATSITLREFLLANVEPGAVVISDSLGSYPAACGEDYRHTSRSTSARRGCQRTCRCPVFIGSLRSPSDGSSVPTTARWRPTTYRRTSTSSASVSTGGTREREGCFSTG
jgi:transposase-like protein